MGTVETREEIEEESTLMKILECMIIFLCCCFLVSFTYAVLETASDSQDIQVKDQQKQEVNTLPQKCAPFYNNGTDDWIECMGVGKK